jgi:hypothetical protein
MRNWFAVLIQALGSALLCYAGYWYLLAAVAFILGLLGRGNTRSPFVGAASLLGTALIVSLNGYSGGSAQAALAAEIIGIPGGQVIPLFITLVYSFVLGALACYAGGALTVKARAS